MLKCCLHLTALSELSDVSAGVPSDVVPPKFTQLLKDIESNEGERVVFECRVIGHPTPAIKWYRGRQEIQNSADFQVSHCCIDYTRFLKLLVVFE